MSALMKRVTSLCLAASLALLLQGCPKPWAINLYNNTSTDIVVHFTDGQAVWAAGKSLRLLDEKERMDWVAAGDDRTTVPELRLERSGRLVKYRLVVFPLPPDYLSGTGTTEVYLQLENDGNLYAARGGPGRAVEELSPQPPGFPIRPFQP